MKSISQILTLFFIHLTCFFSFFSTPAQARFVVRPLDQAVFHNNQGVGYLNQGDPQKALFEFKTATEISPEYSEAWNNLGLTYLYLKDYEQAKTAFHRSIKIDSKFPQPYNHMATLFYTMGNYPEALSWAGKAIKQDKKYADAYFNQGIIYREIARKSGNAEDYQKAEKAFRFATEANQNHYLANLELANLYKAQGKYEQALIRYKTTLEIQPSSADAWQQLGSLYLLKGENDKAQLAFNKAIAANPNLSESHLQLGIYYLQEKNFVLAEKELALAAQADPENPRVKFNLAYAKLSRAEDTRGRSGLNAATALYQQAIQDYQALLAKVPDYQDAAYNLGYAYARIGDTTQAAQWYEKVLKLNPKHPRALFGIASLKYEGGDKKGSVPYFCQFIKSATPDMSGAVTAAQKIVAEEGKCR